MSSAKRGLVECEIQESKRPCGVCRVTSHRGEEESHTIIYGSEMSIGSRKYQEDRLIAGQPLGAAIVFGVFDGHGTDQVSTFLEKNTMSYLQRSFASTGVTPTEAELCQHVSSTFQALHSDVSKDDIDDSIGGSTACLVIVDDERITCGNAGDSRAVLVQSDGVKPLSEDHKPDREDEKKRIHEAGGCVVFNCAEYRVAGVLAMSRAIGDGWMAKYGVSCEPDTTVHQRSSKDEYVIVASDGVWGALSNNEAALIINSALSKLKEKGISRKKSFAVAAKCLVKAAMNRGSADNISAIIIDVKKAPFTQSLPAAVPTEAIQMQASTLPSMTITTSRGHGSKQNIDPILHSLRPIITTKGAGFQPVNHTSITRTRSTDPRLPFSSLHVSSISLPMLFTPLRSALSESLPIDLIV